MLLIIVLFLPISSCYQEFSVLDLKPKVSDDVQIHAVRDLLDRIVPNHSHKFLINIDKDFVQNDKDVFELKKLDNGSLLISATTGVSAAAGFNYYLKYYCFSHISWEATHLNIPEELPYVKLTLAAKDRFRYYQNVCTTSYSFVWWSWEDWEKHIDWMVLNSYNLVLTLNGWEAIWKNVYTKLSLTDAEIDEHLTGPAFLSWGIMGNIRGWGGPLPESWYSRSVYLQHRILKRMRDFGIIPVLPAFAGHVPRAFKRIFPDAQLSVARRWNNFNDTYCCPLLIEPTDPLFQTVGNMFMKELTDEFGTDHVYSCDSFNEMPPTNGDEDYLHDIGQSVYSAMASYDPKAIWLMQGWIFVNEGSFWTENRAKALLTSVPQGKMVVLDLQSELHPQYYRLKSYFGQPFIWCMLHNFGGTLGMFGSVNTINEEVHKTRNMENGTMIGTGLTAEGINQNYVIYELMSESSWRSEPINLIEWFDLYSIRRYGENNTDAKQAWQILKNTVYQYQLSVSNHGLSVMTSRPSVHIQPLTWYDTCDLLQAWNYLLRASILQNNEGYRHDLVDVTRQVLQMLIDEHYKLLIKRFKQKKIKKFQTVSEEFLDMLLDVEKILQSNKDFLLGNWLNTAKRIGSNSKEKGLYEYNARNQITLWGPTGEIVDYANKQWSGMVSDYYYERWRMFIKAMSKSVLKKVPFDESRVLKNIFSEVEEPFTFSQKIYPDYPQGDTLAIAKDIMSKWWNVHQCELSKGEKQEYGNTYK